MFRRNPRFHAELRRDPSTRAQLADHAKRAEGIARATSSRSVANSYVVNAEHEVTLGNTNPFFHIHEWGSVNNPPYAPLRRAVRAAGLRLEETGPQ